MSFIDAVALLNKQVPDAIFDLTAKSVVDFPHISTGSFVIDYITGIGGLPRGRITELHGLQSSGKTTCALMAAAECQDLGLAVHYQDYEHSIDPKYAATLGVKFDPTRWGISQPSSMEEGFRIAKFLMEQSGGTLGMIICDSVAAMATLQDRSHEVGETQIGTQASVMSLSLRQMKECIDKYQVAWVFINQLRDIVDLSWAGQQAARQGPKKTTPGGSALKFYADLRLEFIPTGQEKVEQAGLFGEDKRKVVVGQRARVTAVKNKCAAPFKSEEIFIRHGKGIDSTVPCIELAVKFGLISSGARGGYFKIPEPYCDPAYKEQTVQGKENLVQFFEQNEPLLQILFNDVWKCMINPSIAT